MKPNICYTCFLNVYEEITFSACTGVGVCKICRKDTAMYYARQDELEIAKNKTKEEKNGK